MRTENLLLTHTKPRVLWPNCCSESKVAIEVKPVFGRMEANENFAFIKTVA